MTRLEFLDRLRRGLNGLPPTTMKDIMADYETHFKDAAADGRSEAEVVAALGEPERLARELKAEAGLKTWESTKTPSSAVAAVIALLGLGALDILVLLPIAGGLIGTLVGVFAGSIGLFIAGGVAFAFGPFMSLPGGIAAALLGGFGIMCLAAVLCAITVALSIWLVNGLVWYARLHYRVLQPALDAQSV
jgi:uncharacterized membrane protein